MTELKKFDFQQGFNRETTQYAEEGRWFDGDRVRFRAGRPQNLRGYQTRALGTTFDGSARDIVTWSDSSAIRRIVFGTPDHPCLLYTSPSPRDGLLSRMPSSA